MAQQNRGFRSFMLDPKSSVLNYIAENLPPDHRQQGITPNDHTQSSVVYGPHDGSSAAYVPSLQPEHRDHQGQPNSVSQPFIQPTGTIAPSLSPRPVDAQSAQGMYSPLMHPQVVSNSSCHATPETQQTGVQQPQGSSQTSFSRPLVQQGGSDMNQLSTHQQDPRSQTSEVTSQNHNNGPLSGHSALSPPPAGSMKKSPPQSAQRLYHRMFLSFEASKSAFLAAKSHR